MLQKIFKTENPVIQLLVGASPFIAYALAPATAADIVFGIVLLLAIAFNLLGIIIGDSINNSVSSWNEEKFVLLGTGLMFILILAIVIMEPLKGG